MKALFISDSIGDKLKKIDALKKEDLYECFQNTEQQEITDTERIFIDLVRNKSKIKDIVLFLKGMGLK
jgi:hypothetical protein